MLVILDDFGTGYSNLHCLGDLRPNYIKIDRSFTLKALNNQYEHDLMTQIITMTHKLDLTICVEGIETEDEFAKISELDPDYIQGFTLLGGEPFEPENQVELVHLLKKIRETYPKKSIWCYTGYTYDKDLLEGGKVYTQFTEEMLSYIDTLVDGQFIESQKDITLKFRGSANQRILDLNEK